MMEKRITLREKIRRLHNVGDIVLYRWSAGRYRMAKDYVPLSMVRLDVLTCTKDCLIFSSSAPCLVMVNGKPYVNFRDRGILTVIGGPRNGMNITSGMLKEDETAAEARHCTAVLVDEDHCQKWLENKIMSMGLSPVYPVSRIIAPELSRISRKTCALKPQITNEMKRVLGCAMNAPVDEIIRKFQSNLELFGKETDEGWVVAFDHVATGGCCVAAARGISAGSAMVHKMPLYMFQMEAASRHWLISTAKEMLP